MRLPQPVPELPVSDVQAAGKSYARQMGFSVDWAFDQLYAEWKERGVLVVEELRTTPYNLREFTAQDLDGNRLRVFYDVGSHGT